MSPHGTFVQPFWVCGPTELALLIQTNLILFLIFHYIYPIRLFALDSDRSCAPDRIIDMQNS